MNLSSSSLALFLASTVAAHSAQDIIANPRIAKLLATHQDDGDYACMEEFSELVDCVGGWEGECVTCIGNIFANLTDYTCDYLEGTSICADLGMCIEGPCALEHCIAPAVELELCEDENEVEDECPGLCPDLGWATDKCSARVCPDGVSPGQEDTEIPDADGLTCADGYVYAMTVEAESEQCDNMMEAKATCCPDTMKASLWKDLVSFTKSRRGLR